MLSKPPAGFMGGFLGTGGFIKSRAIRDYSTGKEFLDFQRGISNADTVSHAYASGNESKCQGSVSAVSRAICFLGHAGDACNEAYGVHCYLNVFRASPARAFLHLSNCWESLVIENFKSVANIHSCH